MPSFKGIGRALGKVARSASNVSRTRAKPVLSRSATAPGKLTAKPRVQATRPARTAGPSQSTLRRQAVLPANRTATAARQNSARAATVNRNRPPLPGGKHAPSPNFRAPAPPAAKPKPRVNDYERPVLPKQAVAKRPMKAPEPPPRRPTPKPKVNDYEAPLMPKGTKLASKSTSGPSDYDVPKSTNPMRGRPLPAIPRSNSTKSAASDYDVPKSTNPMSGRPLPAIPRSTSTKSAASSTYYATPKYSSSSSSSRYTALTNDRDNYIGGKNQRPTVGGKSAAAKQGGKNPANSKEEKKKSKFGGIGGGLNSMGTGFMLADMLNGGLGGGGGGGGGGEGESTSDGGYAAVAPYSGAPFQTQNVNVYSAANGSIPYSSGSEQVPEYNYDNTLP